jgi:chromosome segregation ATPase
MIAALAGLAGAWAAAVEGANAVGLASEESADKARLAYESLRDTSAAFRDASVQHWADAKAAAADALGLTAEQATETSDAVQQAATEIGLSADALDALGEHASFAAEGQAALAQATERTAQASSGSAQALAQQVEATLDLVDATQREYAAAERNLRLTEQEASLRVQRLRNLQAEAEARGEVSNAQQIGIRLARAEADGAQAVADATRIRAEAAIAAASALRAKAVAANDETAATLAAIEAAEAHAFSLGLESRAAEETARAARALAAARARASSGASELSSTATQAAEATQRLDGATRSAAASMGSWIANAINGSIDALGSYSQAARDAAKEIQLGWSGSFKEMTAKISELDAAGLVAGDRMDQLRGDLSALEKQAEATAKRAAQLNKAITAPGTPVGWNPFYEGLTVLADFESRLAQAAVSQARMELRTQKLGESLGDLGRQFGSGALSLQDYTKSLKGLESRYRSLGDERLEPLRAALEDAQRKTEALQRSAESTLASLQDELDRMDGKMVSIQERDYQRRRAELQAELEDARAAGDAKTIQTLQESLRVLDQVHAKRMDQLAEQQRKEQEITAERAARDAASAETAAAAPSATTPVRTVRVDLNIGGRTTAVRVVEGDEDDLLEAIRRAGLAA